MRHLLALSLSTVLLLGAGPSLATEINGCDTGPKDHTAADLHIDADFTQDDDQLRIHTRDGHDFRVGRSGTLHLDTQAIPVSPSTQQALASYYQAFRDLKDHAKEIGMRSASLAFSAILHAFLDGEDKADEDQHSKMIKASAQALCGDISRMQTLEASVRAEVPQFGPFVVTDRDAD